MQCTRKCSTKTSQSFNPTLPKPLTMVIDEFEFHLSPMWARMDCKSLYNKLNQLLSYSVKFIIHIRILIYMMSHFFISFWDLPKREEREKETNWKTHKRANKLSSDVCTFQMKCDEKSSQVYFNFKGFILAKPPWKWDFHCVHNSLGW